MKLKPLKFKQNGVRAESQKKKERNLCFCFSFFETQVHIKVSARTAHLCNLAQVEVFLSHGIRLATANNCRPQAECSEPRPSNGRKDGTCPGSYHAQWHHSLQLDAGGNIKGEHVFCFGLNFLCSHWIQESGSGIPLVRMLQNQMPTQYPSSSL